MQLVLRAALRRRRATVLPVLGAVLVTVSLTLPVATAVAAPPATELTPVGAVARPSAGVPTGPPAVVARGRVRNAAGQPVGGRVTAYLDLQPGSGSLALPVVGRAEIGSDGSYELRIAPTSSMADEARHRGRHVNILVLVEGSDGSTDSFELTPRLSDDGATLVPDAGTGPDPLPNLVRRVARVRQPLVTPCGVKSAYGSSWVSWNKVNEQHTAGSTTGYARYGGTFDQKMGIAVSSDGSSWSAGGQMAVQDQGGWTATNSNVTGYMHTNIQAKTNMQRYQINCIGYRTEPVSWIGEIRFAGSASNVNCRNLASSYRVTYKPGVTYTKWEGTSKSFGYNLTAAPVPGLLSVSLTSSVTYGTALEQYWSASSGQHWLCGNGYSPRTAPVVYATDY